MVDPRNSDATLIKAAVYERQNKPELAGEIHAQLTGSTTVRAMLRARAASMEGKNEEATRILLEAVQTDSSDVRLVGMAVNELVTGQRYDEAAKVVASALEAKPDDLSLRQLAVYVRRDLSPEERDRATLEIIAGETDAFQRAADLVMFRSRQNDAAAALKAVDEALGHLRARATPAASAGNVRTASRCSRPRCAWPGSCRITWRWIRRARSRRPSTSTAPGQDGSRSGSRAAGGD